MNHRGILYSLQKIGVGGSLLSVISDFLTERVQRVMVYGKPSRFSEVKSGFAQGSVLGPILIIHYTPELSSRLENELIDYADEFTLIATIPSPQL